MLKFNPHASYILEDRPIRFIIGCTSVVHYMNDNSRRHKSRGVY